MADTAYKAKNVKIAYTAGSDREVYAEWQMSTTTHLKEFTYAWHYYTNSRWFEGSSGSLEYKKGITTFTQTYTPPDNAVYVRFRVKPVAESKSKNASGASTDTPYWTGAFTDWVKFDYLKQKPPTVKVKSSSIKTITTQENLQVEGSWDASNIKSAQLAGFSCEFRYYKDNIWQDGGTVDVAKTATRARFEVTDKYIKKVKFTVKPTPVGSYFYGANTSWKEINITPKERKIDNASIIIAPIAKTDRNYLAYWMLNGVDKTGITAFDYEYEYYRTGATGSSGWMGTGSGSVNFDASETRWIGNRQITTWSFNFDADATASKLRVRVKPVSNVDGTAYNEAWSNYAVYDIKLATREVKDLTLKFAAKTKNTVRARWFIENKNDVASFDYQWRYLVGESHFAGTSGSVNASDSMDSWSTTYTMPDNATAVEFRVKPVPAYANSFLSDWPQKGNGAYIWTRFVPEIPKEQVSGIKVAVYEAATGILRATWDEFKKYEVSNYEYVWTYSLKSTPEAWLDGSTGTTTNNYITYSPPDNMFAVRFTVKANPKYESEFTGDYAEKIELKLSDLIGTRKITDLSLAFQPKSDRKVDASWKVDDKTNVSSFEYVWMYRIVKDGTKYRQNEGSVSIDDYVSTWIASEDFPDNAVELIFKVRPVPSSTLAFSADWSEEKVFDWNIPSKSVSGITIQPYTDLSDRKIYASWIDDTTNVGEYECQWRYSVNNVWWYEDTTTTTVQNMKTDYTIPEEADEVAVQIRPIPEYEQYFYGNYSETAFFSIGVEDVTIPTSYITLRRYTDSSRKLIVNWEFPGYTPNSYEVQWGYFANGTWFNNAETDTIDGDADPLQADYDSPEEAEVVHVRILPVYDSDPTKKPDWSGYVEYNWEIPTLEIENVALSIQRGTKRTVVATWDIPNSLGLDSYDYQWRYILDGIYYTGTSGSTAADTPACTYDAPDNADAVAFKVKAVPSSDTYFVGDYTAEEVMTVPEDTTPETPEVPSVTIEGFSLTATVDSYDEKTDRIEFEIVNETDVWRTGRADVNLARASLTVPVAVGNGYRARARGINADDEAGEWSQYSSEVFTIPAVVSGTIDISATSSTSTELTWDVPAGKPKSYTIEYTTKKRYFDAAPDQVKSVTVSQIGDSTTARAEISGLENPEDGCWYFRIKATNDAGDSEWSEIVSTILGTTPDAPTTWSSTTTATVDREIYLFWIHNSEDGSKEQKAELELDVNGVTTTIAIEKESDDEVTSNYLIEAGTYSAGAKIRWKVRTKGVLDDYGEWSITRQVDIYAPPTLGLYITNGLSGGNMVTFPLVLETVASPASQTPIGYSVSIISNNAYEGNDDTGSLKRVSAGESVYNKYFVSSNHEETFAINPGDVHLVTSMSYTLRVVLTMSSGLSAEAERNFIVRWDEEEYFIDAEVGIDPGTIAAYITPFCTDANEVRASEVTLSVYRREFDGTFTLIAENLPNIDTPTVIDPHPALDYGRYRITARSNITGNVSYYDLPPQPIGETAIVLQWDEQWTSFSGLNEDEPDEHPWNGSMLKLPFNVDISDQNSVDSELVEYIGRRHPVSYYGTQVGQKLTLSASIAMTDKETILALRRLAVYMGDVYVREPSGSGYWSKVEVSFSQTHLETIIPVSLSITRVEGGV